MAEKIMHWWEAVTTKTTPEELLKKISYDKRIDRIDLPEVAELERIFQKEKEQISSETQEKLLWQIEKTLIDGFTVESVEDYEVVKKMLSLLWKKSVLPDYIQASHMTDRTGKSYFSIALNGNKNVLELYSKTPDEVAKNKQVAVYSLRWSISLEDGTFIPATVITQYKIDSLSNNNEFDTNKK